MSAERDDRITSVKPGDLGGLSAHPNKLDRPKAHRRTGAIQDPNAGLAAIIENGAR